MYETILTAFVTSLLGTGSALLLAKHLFQPTPYQSPIGTIEPVNRKSIDAPTSALGR